MNEEQKSKFKIVKREDFDTNPDDTPDVGYCYGLTNGYEIFYVGVTQRDLAQRLAEHISRAKGSGAGKDKDSFIRRMLEADMEPGIVMLDQFLWEEWEETEQVFISRFQSLARLAGYPFFNESKGGRGQQGRAHSEEERAKIREGVKRSHQARKAGRL